ncbi:MAG: LysR substrate-binding domain-containing protein [Verrucomicrobiales bacterium]
MEYSLRELECFLAVAEELSFTRAAKRLRLAQPPLSRHVKMLEARIGTALFNREPRQITLTSAGLVLYEETHDIPRRLLAAGAAAGRTGRGEVSILRLGFVSAVMNDELVKKLKKFRVAHPAVQIMLSDLSPSDQIQALSEGRIDGGFIGVAPQEAVAGITLTPWYRESLVCVIPRDHPLTARKTVNLQTLSEEPMIAVAAAAAPAFVAQVRDLCQKAGFRPRVIQESPRAQAVALMVAAGSGIALLPESAAHFLSESVKALKLQGSPKITHVIARRSSVSPQILKFLDTLS